MSITAVGSSTNYAELTSRMSKEGHHGDLTIEPFMAEQVAKEKKAPYSSMAENGMITYKGVTFVCDDDNQCTQKMFEIEDMENGGNGDLNERF